MNKFYRIAIVLGTALLSGFAASATVHDIEVEDFEFNPAVLTVQVGDTVRWFYDNNAANAHTTTSVSIPAAAAAWDQIIDATSPEFIYVVTAPGTYNYQCTPHASMGMTGSFTATGAPTAVQSIDTNESFDIRFNNNNGMLTVTSLRDNNLLRVTLTDLSGREVKSFDATSMNQLYIGDVTKGLYVVSVRTATDLYARKISLQ